jgi:hypothetical protein
MKKVLGPGALSLPIERRTALNRLAIQNNIVDEGMMSERILGVGLVCGHGATDESDASAGEQYLGESEGKNGLRNVHFCVGTDKSGSKSHHVPGGRVYRQIATTSKGNLCFGSEAEAEKASFRK